MRISGNEPTICKEHLIQVLKLIPEDYTFILETNGILIGNDMTYAEELSRFSNLYVRVSLKGTCEEEFSRLTGAQGFQLQLKALEHLAEKFEEEELILYPWYEKKEQLQPVKTIKQCNIFNIDLSTF